MSVEPQRRNYGLRTMQEVGMDREGLAADDRGMDRLGAAVARALTSTDRTHQWLADEIGVTNGHISRIVNGKIENIAVRMVRQIEDALGLQRGELLREGGFVDVDTFDTVSMIRSDPELDPIDKDALVRMYNAFRGDYLVRNSTAGSSTAPTAPKRRRNS